MSRIGKQPIVLTPGIKVEVKNQEIKASKDKNELKMTIPHFVMVKEQGNKLEVTVKNPADKDQRAQWGLFRVLINNMVKGLAQGFEKKLEIQGIGFKATVSGQKLTLHLGFSHPVEFETPQGIEIKVEKNIISIKGIDKQLVGQTAATIRAIKKPEPYKGKGIRYLGEEVRRKAGKVVKTTTA